MDFSFYPLVDRNSNFKRRFGDSYKSLPKTHKLKERVSLELLDGKEGNFSCNPYVKSIFLSESHFLALPEEIPSPLVSSGNESFPIKEKSVEPESIEFPCMEISCFSVGTSTDGKKILLKFDSIPVSENLSDHVFVYETLSVNDILLKGKTYSNFVRNSIVRLSRAKSYEEIGFLVSSIKNFSLYK